MMLAPTGTTNGCALDLPGLHVDARGDDRVITLVVSVDDPTLVFELQRRVAVEAEQGRHQH